MAIPWSPTKLPTWSGVETYKKPPRAGQTSVAPVPDSVGPPAPMQNIGLTAGFTPNYKSLILSNPAYLQWQNNTSLDVQQADSARKAALRALVIQRGGSEGLQDAYGDIDQNTLDLAKRNEFSDVSRLQRNYTEGVTAMKRSLAARGALQSGDLVYGQEQADRARATSEYDIGREFGNAAQTIVNNYIQRESAARQAQAQALRDAEAAVYANPLNRPTEGTSAGLVSDWQSRFGKPVYQGPDGRLYEIGPDGNPQEYGASLFATPQFQQTTGDFSWGIG